jgi:hypothetical protein
MTWFVDHQRAVHRLDSARVDGVGESDCSVHGRGVRDDHGRVSLGLAAGQLGLADRARWSANTDDGRSRTSSAMIAGTAGW